MVYMRRVNLIKKYDYVLQQNNTDCGIASIITVLMQFGIKPSRNEILRKVKKHRDGYTAYDLIKIANYYNIDASGLKTDIYHIKKLPVIAHTVKNKNIFHFIVIFEINERRGELTIMDPALGIQTISFDEFLNITTNIFLTFKGKKRKVADYRLRKILFKILKSNRKIIVISILLSILYIVLSLLFNYYLKVILSDNISFIIFALFINITFFKAFINYVKNRLILNLNIKIDEDITDLVCNHIFNLPYEYFISKQTGELITTIEDIENFKDLITKAFILSLTDIVLITFIILYFSFINIFISFILIFILITLFFIAKKYQYIFNDSFLKLKNSKVAYNSFLINYFISFETIKNLNLSNKINNILYSKYIDSLKNEKEYNKNVNSYEMIRSLIIDLSFLIIIYISFLLAVKGYLMYSDIVLISSVFYLVINLLNNICSSISFYKVYEISLNRVLDCLDEKSEKFSKTNMCFINKISFRDVSYIIYDKKVLTDINLTIKKGDKVYLSGPSGVGKSTIMKLLLRYYKETCGEILIDNININDLDLSFIRENITYIGQNEVLFAGTILENLELVTLSREKIRGVISITQLDTLGESFILEEGASNISGGERKKIILARGLLHFKNVLILDEVFNEISIFEERTILKNIFDRYPDKIIILISHRNSNTDLFNKKYEIERNGAISEVI